LTGILFLSALVGSAPAQTAPASATPDSTENPKPKEEVIQLNSFVVTGSMTPRKQLESPVAITTLDRGRIDDLGARNFAELVKAVPGIYVESTGGEAFNNVSIRGIGTTSGFSYEMLYEDGLPVIATNNLRHGLPDAWTRMNAFVESVEAMRSGTSNIFASQAPLALINLISREGGSTLRGETTLTVSDYGTLRADLWTSGPAGKNTTFAIGGWYRVDDGVRYPGFTSNKGGELLGNIKHTFENGRGYMKASFKVHNDHNVFDLPMPLTGGANFRSVPFGPDMKSDPTSATADQRIVSVLGTPVGNVQYDLADGIYSQMDYVGTEVQYQLFDGVKLENRNRYSDGYRSIDYIFNGVPATWQAIANAAAGRDAAQFAAGLSGGNYAFRLTYPGQNNAVAAANATAAAALGNGFGNRKSWQHSGGLVTDFQDDLRLVGTFNNDQTTATAGVYYSLLREEQHYLYLTLLTDVTPQVNRMDITILDAITGAAIGPATFNGIYHFADQYRNSTGEEREVSPYALVEHKVGPMTFDAGVRHNSTRQVVTREFTANTFVTNNSTNPALRTGQFGTGNFETRKNSVSETAYTVGANYAFSKHLAVYGRVSRGVRTLGITEFAEDIVAGRVTSPSRIVTGYEAGVKYGSGKVGVVLTAFHDKIEGIQDTQVTILPNGTLGPTVIALQNEVSKGLELETIWTPLPGLSLGANATWQDPKWTDHNLKTQTLSTGQVVAFDENGLTPERTPKIYGKLLGSYQFPATSLGRFAVNASYQYTGKRPVDRANGPIDPLTSYGETEVGVILVTKQGFSLRVTVNNLFDSKGLSEGDPRGGTNVLDPTVSVFNARPIQPRTITGTVSYKF
jgi:outer membrane cobalamin receptor